MGAKTSRHINIDEAYLKPTGGQAIKDVNVKKLRKLILTQKLAPCFPGKDEEGGELEECPICFMNFPVLNRSACCNKGICTECFLQVKSTSKRTSTSQSRPPRNASSQRTSPLDQLDSGYSTGFGNIMGSSGRGLGQGGSTHMCCPFCKRQGYHVVFRGKKTEEERRVERLEEQKVVEAKMRMMEEERKRDEEKQRERQRQAEEQGRQGQGGAQGMGGRGAAEREPEASTPQASDTRSTTCQCPGTCPSSSAHGSAAASPAASAAASPRPAAPATPDLPSPAPTAGTAQATATPPPHASPAPAPHQRMRSLGNLADFIPPQLLYLHGGQAGGLLAGGAGQPVGVNLDELMLNQAILASLMECTGSGEATEQADGGVGFGKEAMCTFRVAPPSPLPAHEEPGEAEAGATFSRREVGAEEIEGVMLTEEEAGGAGAQVLVLPQVCDEDQGMEDVNLEMGPELGEEPSCSEVHPEAASGLDGAPWPSFTQSGDEVADRLISSDGGEASDSCSEIEEVIEAPDAQEQASEGEDAVPSTPRSAHLCPRDANVSHLVDHLEHVSRLNQTAPATCGEREPALSQEASGRADDGEGEFMSHLLTVMNLGS